MTDDQLARVFYDLGYTVNVEGGMFDTAINADYIRSQWRNRREHPELYEGEE